MFSMFLSSAPTPAPAPAHARFQSVLPVVSNPIIWTTEGMTYSTFHSETHDGTYFLDPAHQRNVIKTKEWLVDIINTNFMFGNIPDAYFHPVTLPDGSIRYESLDGKQRCTAVIHLLDNIITYCDTKFCDMSKADQSRLKNLKINMKIASRTLTSEEVRDLFRKFQSTDVTTLGEFINSAIGNKNRQVCLDFLGTNNAISAALSNIMTKSAKTGANRYFDLEILARMFHCYNNSTDGHYTQPDQEDLKDWFNEFSCDSAVYSKFSDQCEKTLVWLSDNKIYHRPKPGVYIPVFLMFQYKAELAPKFSHYITKEHGGKSFSFSNWTTRAHLGAGSNEYWGRYEKIVEYIQ